MILNTKIIFTVTTDLNYDQRMQRICSTLAQEGYAVKLIGRKQTNSRPLQPTTFQQKRLTCFFQKGKFFYLEYNIRLFFYLLFQKADIICGIDLDSILPAFFIAKIRRKQLVYDAHEYFTGISSLHGRPFEKKIWEAIERFTLPKTKYAYTVNQSIADLFKKEYGLHFEVIRNVPFYREIVQKTATSKKYILYQGALNKGRGLEFLIQCMPEIDLKLKIAGNGPIKIALEKMCLELNVKNKVEFLGFVLPEDLKEISDKAWLGINLIEDLGLSYYYSLANKFFDYIQSEIPQICTDFPEYHYLTEQYSCALLLKTFDKKAFVEKISQLQNPEYYQTFVKNAQIAKEELNWDKERQVLINFYKKLSTTP